MYLKKENNESNYDFKFRYLKIFIEEIKSTFYLRHSFELSCSHEPPNEKNIPALGSVIWLTDNGVYYYFIPYCEPGSEAYCKYRLNNINEFINGPLTRSVLTGNAPYDLKELNNLPENIREVSDRLEELNIEQKSAAREEMEFLKGDNENASTTDMFQKYKKHMEDNNYSTKFTQKSVEYCEYAKEITPIAHSYLKLLLSKLSSSDLAREINKVIFNQ
jgi:hypothetical protein